MTDERLEKIYNEKFRPMYEQGDFRGACEVAQYHPLLAARGFLSPEECRVVSQISQEGTESQGTLTGHSRRIVTKRKYRCYNSGRGN